MQRDRKVKAGGRRILEVAAILWWLPAASFALNPVIQTMYTADPASVTVATLPAEPRPLVP